MGCTTQWVCPCSKKYLKSPFISDWVWLASLNFPFSHSIGWCYRLHGWSLLRQFIILFAFLVITIWKPLSSVCKCIGSDTLSCERTQTQTKAEQQSEMSDYFPDRSDSGHAESISPSKIYRLQFCASGSKTKSAAKHTAGPATSAATLTSCSLQ